MKKESYVRDVGLGLKEIVVRNALSVATTVLEEISNPPCEDMVKVTEFVTVEICCDNGGK